MKKMSTEQKISHNRVTAKRIKRYLKRREHVRVLKLAHKRIAVIDRQLEKIRYFQHKNQSRTSVAQRGTIL